MTRLDSDGFRNLSEPVHFAYPLSVIVGENNAGKSNVIDALRLTLTPLTGWPLRLRRDDFAHEGTGEPAVDEITISARFEGLNFAQSGRMVTALDGDRTCASLHLRSQLPDVGPVRVRHLGGQAMTPDVEEWARTAVTYTYLPPLRDAEEALRPGRSNRLVELVAALAGDGPDQEAILKIAGDANDGLAAVQSVVDSRDRIQSRLSAISGQHQAQQAQLAFSDPLFERVLSTLNVRIGDMAPLAMSQNGLGLNNVLYMSVLLAALTYNHGSDLHLLLVEEPEAHIHPQMQDLLMRFLETEVSEREDVQVIVTTHSPNFAARARVERVTSLSRQPPHIASRAIGQFGLEPEEYDHLGRFLDATKASLLFARAVILVEGLAEQLVLPVLSSQLSPPLDPADFGVSIINVGGLAFGPFAALFDDGRLPGRCAIVSDADPPKAEDDPVESDSEDQSPAESDTTDEEVTEPSAALSATAQKLLNKQNSQRRVFLSSKTFEHDLVVAGNWEWAIEALSLLKPRVAKRLAGDESLQTAENQADAILEAVDGSKGRFAQALTATVDTMAERGIPIVVPGYLKDAIEWVCQPPPPAVALTDQTLAGAFEPLDDSDSGSD